MQNASLNPVAAIQRIDRKAVTEIANIATLAVTVSAEDSGGGGWDGFKGRGFGGGFGGGERLFDSGELRLVILNLVAEKTKLRLRNHQSH